MTFVLHPLLVMLASLAHQELARQVVFLREENRILRLRLSKRIGVTPSERIRRLTLGRDLGTQLRVARAGQAKFLSGNRRGRATIALWDEGNRCAFDRLAVVGHFAFHGDSAQRIAATAAHGMDCRSN